MLPRTAQYALRAVAFLAAQRDADTVPAATLADAIGAPRNYLSKTLHALVQADILHSERGPDGGFALAVPADRLTLARVIAPFSGVRVPSCLLDRADCYGSGRCRVHERWHAASGRITRFLNETVVAAIAYQPPADAAATNPPHPED